MLTLGFRRRCRPRMKTAGVRKFPNASICPRPHGICASIREKDARPMAASEPRCPKAVAMTQLTRRTGGQRLGPRISFKARNPDPVHDCPRCKRRHPDSLVLSMSCVTPKGSSENRCNRTGSRPAGQDSNRESSCADGLIQPCPNDRSEGPQKPSPSRRGITMAGKRCRHRGYRAFAKLLQMYSIPTR